MTVGYVGYRFEWITAVGAAGKAWMTVALVLAAEADAGMCGQLAALGVRRVDLAGAGHSGDYGSGLLTVAAAARVAGERVLICVGEGAVPGDVLARLLGAGSTAAFTGAAGVSGSGALVVDTPDLEALAGAAEWLAASPPLEDALGALLSELARRGVSTRVLDAGPDGEGACAQLLADPVAIGVAKWALARELAPTSLCGISLGLGLIAAVWFAAPTLGSKAIGVGALASSFVAGRAGSLVAASGRWAEPALDWLSTASALLIEFGVYLALAFSAERGAAGLDGVFGSALRGTIAGTWGGAGSIGVWRLAMAAMGMVGIRRLTELCYDRAADGHGLHRAVMRRIEQAITLPAGERYAVIAVTVLLFGPRVTFLALLCWGAIAIAYVLAGRVLGSAVMTAVGAGAEGQTGGHRGVVPRGKHGISDLPAYRNDGAIARWIGGVVQGRLPPLLPVLVGLMVTCTLAALGLANLPGILVLTPVEGMLLAALGAQHPHDGRRDWLVPPLLLAGEYVFLAALGLSHQVPPAAVFALLAAVVLRHIDVGYRARHGSGISADVLGLGWDGRMLLLGLAAMVGEAPLAYFAVSVYLWVLFGWDFLGGWLADTSAESRDDDEVTDADLEPGPGADPGVGESRPTEPADGGDG
jgi:hypothetical protein